MRHYISTVTLHRLHLHQSTEQPRLAPHVDMRVDVDLSPGFACRTLARDHSEGTPQAFILRPFPRQTCFVRRTGKLADMASTSHEP